MKNSEISAASDNHKQVKLSGFTFIADQLSDEFEVCLVIENDGHLSAGCWDTGTDYTKDGEPGVFCQSRGGVLEVKDILAWLPIEETCIDINRLCWNPKYHLIADFCR